MLVATDVASRGLDIPTVKMARGCAAPPFTTACLGIHPCGVFSPLEDILIIGRATFPICYDNLHVLT